MSEDIDALLARVQTRLNDGGQIFRRETVAPLVAALVEARERAEIAEALAGKPVPEARTYAGTKILEPGDFVTLTVNDFETKYVSRVSFDAMKARLAAAEQEAARLREVAYITAEKEKERIDRLFARIEHYQRELIKFQGIAARLLEYDERNGPLNFQYEKLRDFLREFEAMLPKCDRATDAALNPPEEAQE